MSSKRVRWWHRLQCLLLGHLYRPAYEFRPRRSKRLGPQYRYHCCRCDHVEPWRELFTKARFDADHNVSWRH